jgi:hypothetical protein
MKNLRHQSDDAGRPAVKRENKASGARMPRNIIIVFLFGLTLSAFGAVPESVNGQEAPSVVAYANAPGWITVLWEHTGIGVFWFEIHRQDPPYAVNSFFLVAKSANRTDSLIDKNLRADTIYKYRVCAVYSYSQSCTDWISVKTQSPPPAGSSGSPPPARAPLATPGITATQDQDPKHIVLDWSGDPGWSYYGTDWNARPEYKHPRLNNVVVSYGIPSNSRSSVSLYDAQKFTPIWYGNLISLLSVTASVRANTVYTFKVCFTSRDDETKCSNEITSKGKPVEPTAPADVKVVQDKLRGNATDLTARIRTLITASWRNTDIPGRFITLEREDRVQLDRLRVGAAWVEIKRISAEPRWTGEGWDPTELTVDVTPEGLELLTRRGNSYRVCAVVPALGTAGKVCSLSVSPTIANSRSDLNTLAARGAVLANEDPLVAKLRNQRLEGPARRGFDIGMAAAEGQTLPGPAKKRIYDSLPPAEQEGFDAAVILSLARNRNKVTDLAPRGAKVASQDPLADELRNQQQEGPARLGFDIGMAAAEGQTLPGPGKQRIHDSLYQAEKGGFSTAVAFSLERNRNADLARVGTAIAEADPVVAAARDTTTDVFYRLGFDIATGIFGNRALGAKGNTATGPGSLKIRDALSATAQRGFNASVQLHLSRHY